MAKTRSRARRVHKKRNQQYMVSGVALIAIVLIVAVVYAASSDDAPEVAEARLTLDPVLGDVNAPVTIIEYGAYGCHACESWHNSGIIETIMAEYPGQVNFVFRDFPVISPRYDQMAAETAQCALDQGNDQFWALHDALYTFGGPGTAQDTLYQLGEQVGLDVDALRACVDANTHQRTVAYDEQRARRLGFNGTPSFVVNGKRVEASPDALRRAIEAALN